jgi:tetratricopeptide (TPR) repeat protein
MIKKSLLYLVVSLLGYFTTRAQELVTFQDLTFSSETEKTVFDDYFNKKVTDHFQLFMANGSLLKEPAIKAAQKRFTDYLQTVQAEKLQVKKNEKKVKILYEDIHKTFLTKYETENKFEDIFYNGYFNCVSASALYGLAFQTLGIPFVIKEKPDHVYVIAFPDQESIMVETTSPTAGFYQADLQFKTNFVKVLKEQKLISAQEFGSKTVEELFDKFYFGNDIDINLTQLAGIQYMNAGIFLMQNEKFNEAFNEIEKAYLFYPSDRIGYLLMASGYDAFQKSQKKDLAHARLLGKLSRYKKYGVTTDMVTGEYYNVVQELLFNKGERENLVAYYDHLISVLDNVELRSEITFLHNYEHGRYFYNKARYKESLPYFEECLKIKPRHEESLRNTIIAIAESSRNKPNPEVIETFESYFEKYPALAENNIFNQMLGSAYLIQVRISFEMNKATEGETYKSKFEKFYAAHSEVNFDGNMIGNAYSAGAVYYFKKGQTSKSKAFLAKGIEMAPNNYELQSRKRMIEN